MIQNVFLAVTGSHIESLNNRGTITLPDDQGEINEEDLEEVKEIARDVTIPQQNVFLHSIIRHYFVDGQEKVLNPVGMFGKRLEADYHIIHGIRTRIQNTIRCVREIDLEVEDVVVSAIASTSSLCLRIRSSACWYASPRMRRISMSMSRRTQWSVIVVCC